MRSLPSRSPSRPCALSLLLALLLLLPALGAEASSQSLLFASHTAGPPGSAPLPNGNALPDAAARLAPAQCESFLRLISMDGGVPVVDTPSQKNVRFHLKAGSVVRLINQSKYEGQTWYLIAPLERPGSGWVPRNLVRLAEEVEPTLTLARACTGSHYHPSASCGTTLPLPTAPQDGVWLWTHFIGMNSSDEVQWVLTINGKEHYASPLVPWASGCAGQTLIALHTLNPRYEPGFWEIRFLVNGKQVSRDGFHVR